MCTDAIYRVSKAANNIGDTLQSIQDKIIEELDEFQRKYPEKFEKVLWVGRLIKKLRGDDPASLRAHFCLTLIFCLCSNFSFSVSNIPLGIVCFLGIPYLESITEIFDKRLKQEKRKSD